MNESIPPRKKDFTSPFFETSCPHVGLQKHTLLHYRSGLVPIKHPFNLRLMPPKAIASKSQLPGCGHCLGSRVPSLEKHKGVNTQGSAESICTCVLLNTRALCSTTQPSSTRHPVSAIMKESQSHCGQPSSLKGSIGGGGGFICYFFCPKLLLFILCLVLDGMGVRGSEFPGRECCDSVPPPPPNYQRELSTTTSTTQSPNSNISSGK